MPIVLITAGSAGLGAAAARLFANKGYHVVINYNSNAERANATLRELPEASPDAAGQKFTAIKADLASREDIIRLVQETKDFAVAATGRSALDVVFSNGGWTQLRNIRDLDDNVNEDDWDRCFNMNVKSHLWLMHAARPYLDEAEGSFITTASLAGIKSSGSSLVRPPWTEHSSESDTCRRTRSPRPRRFTSSKDLPCPPARKSGSILSARAFF